VTDGAGPAGASPTSLPAPSLAGAEGGRSLYERVGGDEVVGPAVVLLYQRVMRDPAVREYFTGIDLRRLISHQRNFLAGVLGGPGWFTGRSLRHAHRRLRIDDEVFDVMVDHLVAALRDVGAASDVLDPVRDRVEELRGDIVSRPADQGWHSM